MKKTSTVLALNGSKLAKVNVLIIDPDKRITDLLRRVLVNLGFGAIYIATDGGKGIQIIEEKPVDLIITDWDMEPMDGLSFICNLRANGTQATQTLPIIMLTGRAQRRDVERARDSGMNEFLVKPFTVKTLCERIILVVEHPRNFILSHNYKGPDRRRKALAWKHFPDRRSKAGDMKIVAEHEKMKVYRVGEEDVTLVDADTSIKEKIGFDISLDNIFSPESVKRAQDIIHNSTEDFVEWVADDLNNLNDAFGRLEQSPASKQLNAIFCSRALGVKSQAGMFGYDLASQVAESLYDICYGIKKLDSLRLRAARQHIDALYVIFQRNIQGKGGIVGRDLMQSLNELTIKLNGQH